MACLWAHWDLRWAWSLIKQNRQWPRTLSIFLFHMLQCQSSIQNFCWINQPHWSLVDLAYGRQKPPNRSPSCTLSVLLCKLYLAGTAIAARMESPRALNHKLSTTFTPPEVLLERWSILAGITGLGCFTHVTVLGKELANDLVCLPSAQLKWESKWQWNLSSTIR